MSLRIARVQHTDPRLVELHRMTLPQDRMPPWSSGWWWIAFDNGAHVAFAGLQPSLRWCDAAYLVRCGVADTHRGMGLQRRLVQVRERHARALGTIRWLISDTRDNPQSANNLIRCGFTLYEPSAPYAARGTLYWKKRIA